MAGSRRAHVMVPAVLVEEVDALVGPRRRSEFFAAAISEKLARARLLKAAEELGGSLRDVDIPGWETSEAAVEWVHNLRREPEAIS